MSISARFFFSKRFQFIEPHFFNFFLNSAAERGKNFIPRHCKKEKIFQKKKEEDKKKKKEKKSFIR